MRIESHLYRNSVDLQAIIVLITQVRPRQRLADYPGLVDLQELLSLPEVQARTRLWLDEQNNLAGYAFVDEMSNLYFEAGPGVYSALEESLLDWAIVEARQAAQERQHSDTPGISCRSDDLRKMALLESRGFSRLPGALHMVRPLGDPIPAPVLPPGFTIRPGRGAEEAEAWVALHRAAHGTDYMTVERRLSIIAVDEFDPALDLVAVAPNGRLAAYCIGSISARENTLTGRKNGYTDPVATHPDFQRRGLCRALLCAVMRLLRERGMDTARLSTSQENLAMRSAAEAVGYQVEAETYWYELAYP
jgi:ribosomal protein S18 acetylase RimI-like enzyme